MNHYSSFLFRFNQFFNKLFRKSLYFVKYDLKEVFKYTGRNSDPLSSLLPPQTRQTSLATALHRRDRHLSNTCPLQTVIDLAKLSSKTMADFYSLYHINIIISRHGDTLKVCGNSKSDKYVGESPHFQCKKVHRLSNLNPTGIKLTLFFN